MRKTATTLALGAVLVGCASSGVIPIGDGVMMLTKKGAGGVVTPGAEVLADLYKEANTYCGQQNKQIQTVSSTSENAIPFVRFSSAELHFRCVSPTANAQQGQR